jgi:tRNA 2-selenouridine synthase
LPTENKGQEKAIELGHELVQGDVKNKRIEAWLQFIKHCA